MEQPDPINSPGSYGWIPVFRNPPTLLRSRGVDFTLPQANAVVPDDLFDVSNFEPVTSEIDLSKITSENLSKAVPYLTDSQILTLYARFSKEQNKLPSTESSARFEAENPSLHNYLSVSQQTIQERFPTTHADSESLTWTLKLPPGDKSEPLVDLVKHVLTQAKKKSEPYLNIDDHVFLSYAERHFFDLQAFLGQLNIEIKRIDHLPVGPFLKLTWLPDNPFLYDNGRLWEQARQGVDTDSWIQFGEEKVRFHKAIVAPQCKNLDALIGTTLPPSYKAEAFKAFLEFAYLKRRPKSLDHVNLLKATSDIAILLDFDGKQQFR